MEFRAISSIPMVTSAPESEDPTAQQPGKKRRREEVAVATATSTTPYLSVLPNVILKRFIDKWLDLPERMLLSRCNWSWSREIGDRPIYVRVLASSGLGDPNPVTPCARRIGRAILEGNRLVMSEMADALCCIKLQGPTRQIVSALFSQSIADPTHPLVEQLKDARLTSLWNRQWLGHPPTDETDSVLWNQHLGEAMDAGLSQGESVQLTLQVYKRAVLGFCSNEEIPALLADVTTMAADETLHPLYRKDCEVLRDLIRYFVADNDAFWHVTEVKAKSEGAKAAKQAAWMTCRAHLTTSDGQPSLTHLELGYFVCLLDLQKNFNYTQAPAGIAWIAQVLLTNYKNKALTPHERALNGLTLVQQRLEMGITIISDEEACRMLAKILSQEYIRDSVRRQAEMLLMSFQVGGRMANAPFTAAHVLRTAMLAMLSIRNQSNGEHGLPVNIQRWALDVLVRLRLKLDYSISIPTQLVFGFAYQLSVLELPKELQRFYKFAMAMFRYQSAERLMLPAVPPAAPVEFHDRDAMVLLTELLQKETRPDALRDVQSLIDRMHEAGRV